MQAVVVPIFRSYWLWYPRTTEIAQPASRVVSWRAGRNLEEKVQLLGQQLRLSVRGESGGRWVHARMHARVHARVHARALHASGHPPDPRWRTRLGGRARHRSELPSRPEHPSAAASQARRHGAGPPPILSAQFQGKLAKEWNKLETAKPGTFRNRGYKCAKGCREGEGEGAQRSSSRLGVPGARVHLRRPPTLKAETMCRPALTLVNAIDCRLALAVLAREDPQETFLKAVPSTPLSLDIAAPVSRAECLGPCTLGEARLRSLPRDTSVQA